ncbi:MAG: bile acid:sodium symporter family protein [Nitrospirota bacterium]|nr:bile acid:sodium symporter family protein [Nitrospirota bacterium]
MCARRLGISPFTIGLLLAVIVASVFPFEGKGVDAMNAGVFWGIVLLFFLHGAVLSRETALRGLLHWRLHLLVLFCTFGLFPLFGLALQPLATRMLTPELYAGVLFLCVLPSTVQSSIAFTAIAKGNVSAAVCSATLSNLLGIFLTPLLFGAFGVLLSAQGDAGVSLSSVGTIIEQLLVPFIVGQALHDKLWGWIARQKRILDVVDQGVILLIVYAAFSEAVAEGLWSRTPPAVLLGVLLVSVVLLALAIGITSGVSKKLGFCAADRVAIVFCGSKKSLASGLPMAQALFGGQTASVGAIVLPLMVYHQLQLLVCAVLAERYRARQSASPPVPS